MAEEKLNMSLDAIIATARTREPKVIGGSANQRVKGRSEHRNLPSLSRTQQPAPSGRGRGRGRAPRGGDAPMVFSVRPSFASRKPTFNGPLMKRQGRPSGLADPVRAQAMRDAALNGPGRWQHDLFTDVNEGATLRRSRAAPPAQGTTLLVSNLDYKVDDNDIKELFSLEGPLLKWGVIYDASGRSDGQAEVTFKERADATRALQRYNGVSLDNKQMKITMATVGSNTIRTLSSGISVTRTAPESGPRTGLQLPRLVQQATQQAAARPTGRSIGGGVRGRGRAGGRLRSSVVAGGDDVGEEFMDTN